MEQIKIKMAVNAEIYREYKALAESKAFQVTKLSKILLEEKIKEWIKKNEGN